MHPVYDLQEYGVCNNWMQQSVCTHLVHSASMSTVHNASGVTSPLAIHQKQMELWGGLPCLPPLTTSSRCTCCNAHDDEEEKIVNGQYKQCENENNAKDLSYVHVCIFLRLLSSVPYEYNHKQGYEDLDAVMYTGCA